jgi:hypothetical protein
LTNTTGICRKSLQSKIQYWKQVLFQQVTRWIPTSIAVCTLHDPSDAHCLGEDRAELVFGFPAGKHKSLLNSFDAYKFLSGWFLSKYIYF